MYLEVGFINIPNDLTKQANTFLRVVYIMIIPIYYAVIKYTG